MLFQTSLVSVKFTDQNRNDDPAENEPVSSSTPKKRRTNRGYQSAHMGSYGKQIPARVKGEVKDGVRRESQERPSTSDGSSIASGSSRSTSSSDSIMAPAPALVRNAAYEIVPRSLLSQGFVLSQLSALLLERLRYQKLTLVCRPHSHRHNTRQFLGGTALDPRYQIPLPNGVHHLEYVQKRRKNEIARLETRKTMIKDSITVSLSRTYKEPQHAVLKHEIQQLLETFLDLICPPTVVDDYD